MTNVLVLGKFFPLHRGHVNLIKYAQTLGQVTVVVGPRWEEHLSVETRVRWIKEECPGVAVCTVSHDLPSYPEDDPTHFWDRWITALTAEYLPKFDRVVGSEDYIYELAARLGAIPTLYDKFRIKDRVCATEVREDMLGMWDYLPAAPRRHFRQLITVTGGESTGKTTLVQRLEALHPSTYTAVYEYGRYHMAGRTMDSFTLFDAARIASVQNNWIRKAITNPLSRGLVISDTDALTTLVWCEMAGQPRGRLLEAMALKHVAHLTVLIPPTLPWVNDGTREWSEPRIREDFYSRLKNYMSNGMFCRPFIIGSTNVDETHENIQLLVNTGGLEIY